MILNKEKPKKASPTRDWILSATAKPGNATVDQPAETPWGEGELQWEHGSRGFWGGNKDAKADISSIQPEAQLPVPVPRQKRWRPSDAGHGLFSQAATAAGSVGGQEFGTVVHEIFEQIEWWESGQSLEGDKEAVALVRKCMAVPEILALFTQETGRDEALRELPMEFMEKDTWWSGIIDRLVLRRDADGSFRKAVLIDFKTDRAETAITLRERYSEQLAIYRRAISTALKLGDDQVEVVLVSTHLKTVVRVS